MSEEPQWTAWKAYLNSLFRTGGAGYELIKETSLATGVDPSERTVGRLFWRDDMEKYNVVKWGRIFPANTQVQYINTVAAYEGDYVLSISNPTDHYCEASTKFGALKKEQKTAYEVRWFYRSGLMHITFAQVRCGQVAADGLWAWIRWIYSRSDGHPGWIYYDPSGVIADLPGGIEYIDVDTWNYCRLVADWDNEIYDRLITNNLDIDLSSLSLPLRTVTETPGHFRIHVNPATLATVALPYPIYVDDARLYLNVE